jgi:hypothetical protein
MGGWSGVALSGLGAGIGKALEPDNIMRIKQFTDEIKWSEASAKIEEDTKNEFKNKFNPESSGTELPAKQIPTPEDFSSKTKLPSNTLSRDPQLLIDSTAEQDSSGIPKENTATVEVVDKAPKPYVFKPDDDLIKLVASQKKLELAMKMGNMKAAQEAASIYDFYNKKHASKIRETAIQAVLLGDEEKFQDAMTMFWTGKGLDVPKEYSGVPKFVSNGVNQLTGQPEKILQYKSGAQIALWELNSMFDDDFSNITRPDNLRGGIGGSDSSSKTGAFYVTLADGSKKDVTPDVMNMMSNMQFFNNDTPPSSAEGVYANAMKFMNLAERNPEFFKNLLKIQINPEMASKPNSPLHLFFQPLSVPVDATTGKPIFENEETQKVLEPLLTYIPIQREDGTLEKKYYINISKVAEDFLNTKKNVEQNTEQYSNLISNIKGSFSKPFPTGNNKEQVRKEREAWYKDLLKHILTNTDFQVGNPKEAYFIANKILEDYKNLSPRVVNAEQITQQVDNSTLKKESRGWTPWTMGKLGVWDDASFKGQQAALKLIAGENGYRNYDINRANLAGYKPDSNGHWPSVNEVTEEEIKDYELPDGSFYSLKQFNHPTLNLSVEEESKLGRKPVQHVLNKRIFFIPKDAPLPPNMINYKTTNGKETPSNNIDNSKKTQNNNSQSSIITSGIGKQVISRINKITSNMSLAALGVPQQRVRQVNQQVEDVSGKGIQALNGKVPANDKNVKNMYEVGKEIVSNGLITEQGMFSLMAQLSHESSGNPSASAIGETSFGSGQWNKQRAWDMFKTLYGSDKRVASILKEVGRDKFSIGKKLTSKHIAILKNVMESDKDSIKKQMNYVFTEINNKNILGNNGKQMLKELMNDKNATQAAWSYFWTNYYFRPKNRNSADRAITGLMYESAFEDINANKDNLIYPTRNMFQFKEPQ